MTPKCGSRKGLKGATPTYSAHSYPTPTPSVSLSPTLARITRKNTAAHRDRPCNLEHVSVQLTSYMMFLFQRRIYCWNSGSCFLAICMWNREMPPWRLPMPHILGPIRVLVNQLSFILLQIPIISESLQM